MRGVWAEVLSLRQILRHERNRIRINRRRLQEPHEQGHTLSYAFGKHRQGGVALVNSERRLVHDRPSVDLGYHLVNRNAMGLLASIDRPTDRIQTSVARQWPRVQVETPNAR